MMQSTCVLASIVVGSCLDVDGFASNLTSPSLPNGCKLYKGGHAEEVLCNADEMDYSVQSSRQFNWKNGGMFSNKMGDKNWNALGMLYDNIPSETDVYFFYMFSSDVVGCIQGA